MKARMNVDCRDVTPMTFWWQGYQGSVALFDWPTLYDFDSFWDVATDLRHFDNSEFRAWLSSDALAAKFAILNADGQLRVLAHSMGNVVTASALRKYTGQPVHTYIATQAALSAQFFDSSVAQTANCAAFSGVWPDTPDTPDIQGYFPPARVPYLGNVLSRVQDKYNYFNRRDWALAKWQIKTV